jgi:hypothetical protein
MTVFDGVLIGLVLGTINGALWGYLDGRTAERKHQEGLRAHRRIG